MADAKLMTLDISSDLPSDTAFPFDHKDRAPDYSNLDEVISKTDSEAVKAICTLFRNYGSGEYIGEQITQWEHALQAAYMAKRAGAEEEVIIAALLHDIGHIYALAVHSKDYMGDYGASRHEHVGAEFLLSLGFTPLVASLVRRHVDAKRYLTCVQPSYMNKLSEASKVTLRYQGGPMSREEAERFEQDPLKSTILLMRTWDEKAKIVGWVGPGFDVYAPLLAKYSSPERAKQYRERTALKLADASAA